MKDFVNRLERRFGAYAIPNLTRVIIGCYVIGYILERVNPNAMLYMMLEPGAILRGQIWRIITWMLVPPGGSTGGLGIFFTIIMLFFYLSIGSSLERAWGDFRYNLYIFGGMLISLITAFIVWGIFRAASPSLAESGALDIYIGMTFSTSYVVMSILLAFAATFPEVQVMLYFVIPIKMKWIGILDGCFILYDIIQDLRLIFTGDVIAFIPLAAVISSLLNFVIFFFMSRDLRRFSFSEQKRKRDFKRSYAAGEAMARNRAASARGGNENRGPETQKTVKPQRFARHRCCICGRTEISDPELEFRYCSKCEGSYEYCMDHLYTHTHVKASDQTQAGEERQE